MKRNTQTAYIAAYHVLRHKAAIKAINPQHPTRQQNAALNDIEDNFPKAYYAAKASLENRQP